VTIKPGPVLICVQPDGSVRKVPNFNQTVCKPPAIDITLPPTSGNVYFCAWNTTGVLRYVTDPLQCTSKEFPVFVSPNDTAPAVTTTSPANGATHVAVGTNITITFNEPVTFSTSSFSLECPSGTAESFTVSGSGTDTATLDPTADLPEGTTCAAKAIANNISDVDSNDPPDHPTADYSFSFTTEAAPIPTQIRTKQSWIPNDTATVTSAIGDLGADGSVAFGLYADPTCTGAALYSETVTVTGGSPSEEVSTSNQGSGAGGLTITSGYTDAAGSISGPHSWKVVYTPNAADTAHLGVQSVCDAEHFATTYTNDPGPNS
jgi:large repetitive protein